MSEVTLLPSEMQQLLAIGLRLCLALETQAQALNALAASNERLADEVAAQVGEGDPDAEPNTYMDGTPIKHS